MDTFTEIFKKRVSGAYPYTAGAAIELGNYGFLKDGIFKYQGNISALGIKFVTKEWKLDQQVTIASGSTAHIVSNGTAGADALGSAQLDIYFQKDLNN